jgi:hypothetical protein
MAEDDREHRAEIDQAFENLKAHPLGPLGVMEIDPKKLEPDNWKHRSKGMKCSSCMWYMAKGTAQPAASTRRDLGRCRRHAPTMSGFPVMFASDWCGDHKLDEEKIDAD